MELWPIIIQIVTGIIGGEAIGTAVSKSMPHIVKIISGAIGGVAGGQILEALGVGGAAAAGTDLGGALSNWLPNIVGGAGGGAILTAIVGAVMGNMKRA